MSRLTNLDFYRRCFVLTALLLTLSHVAMAQSGKLFSTDNQLSSSFATQVMEDHNGFIWIATRNGLNRYDGYNFTTFTKDQQDNLGFNSNYINCLGEDHQGRLIIGTNFGIMVYDGARFNSLKMLCSGNDIKCYTNSILTRKDGSVLISTSGYGLMQIDKSYTKCVQLKADFYKYRNVRKAYEDHRGQLWFISEDFKLHRLEKNGKITHAVANTAGLSVVDVAEDSRGNFYAATSQQGVYVMKAGSSTFSKIDAINLPFTDRLYITKSNMMYVGSDGNGIISYDIKTGAVNTAPVICYQTNVARGKVNSIIEDRHGNLWFSMLQKGVFMQPRKNYNIGYAGFRLGEHNPIGDNCITSVLLSTNHRIWLGTDKNNLYSLSPEPGAPATHYTNTPATILALCEDRFGNIWLGSYREGTGYIDAGGTFHQVDLGLGSDASIFDIKCDPQGNIWFATMGRGVICLKHGEGQKQYLTSNNADSSLKANGLPNNYIMKLAFSPDYSKLYVASSTGLSCLDLRKNSWVSAFGTNCLRKGSFSHCVKTDRKGRIWYGTEDGAYVYDLKDIAHPKHYSTKNGLSSNGVAFFCEDAKGNMWVGTTHGLNCINTKTDEIQTFYTGTGLQSNEFSDGAACCNAKGDLLVMGGTGGINWLNPLTIKQQKEKLNVYVSSFILNNAEIYAEQKSGVYTITKKPVHSTDHFELAHEDNSFTLQLSTLTYDNVEQIAYSYSINGEEWRTIQPGQNDITFSHMPAGTYHFRIKATANDRESDIREFTVTVHPVWYASIWAKIGYVLILCAVVYLYLLHRKRKEQDRLILQQHIHAEEMGEAKLKFFMNISHEIRTPLTLIITPLLSLIKEDKDPRRQGLYDIMHKNSERILHLINQMMDLRKIDKGQMVMHMAETDMVAFLNDEYMLFKQQAVAKNINFQFRHDADTQSLWVDRNNFDKVIMNLLSNAFKFTPTGGKILMALSYTDHHACISIKDNGTGIEEDKLETIFQRFYQSQTNATDRNVGTGIGLDLTRSLVELHYGTIVARNNKDGDDSEFQRGSEFLVRLPLGNAHLQPEEMIEEAPEYAASTEEEENDEALMQEVMPEETGVTDDGTKQTIAIVEDDDAILEFLDSQLQDDYDVISFHNGKEALPEIIKQQPALVITDIMMPEMDGNTLCAKLKANVNTNHIPVILLTAMSREEDQLNGLQTGADAYIVKPFNMDILRRTVINLMSVRRTLRNKYEGKEGSEEQLLDVKVESADDVLMERIMQAINENIQDEQLSVDMIAQQVGISRVHLHRKMKELTNQTPHSFIRNLRLKQAAKILRESPKNISEVMYACGFSNPASFSTMFKNLYGCSPREYMNQQHGKE